MTRKYYSINEQNSNLLIHSFTHSFLIFGQTIYPSINVRRQKTKPHLIKAVERGKGIRSVQKTTQCYDYNRSDKLHLYY